MGKFLGKQMWMNFLNINVTLEMSLVGQDQHTYVMKEHLRRFEDIKYLKLFYYWAFSQEYKISVETKFLFTKINYGFKYRSNGLLLIL